jgi:hypothetical protein
MAMVFASEIVRFLLSISGCGTMLLVVSTTDMVAEKCLLRQSEFCMSMMHTMHRLFNPHTGTASSIVCLMFFVLRMLLSISTPTIGKMMLAA